MEPNVQQRRLPHGPVGPSDNRTVMAHVIYALYALGLFTVLSTAVVGVVLAYFNRDAGRGTWLEGHARWQIRTFWYGLLWVSLCLLFVVFTLGIGVLIVWLPAAIVALWFVYRIVRGWLRLAAGRPMYA